MSASQHPSPLTAGLIGRTAARPATGTPVKVALIAAMCTVCCMAGLLMGVLVSGGQVTQLLRVVTRAASPRTITHVTTRTIPGSVTTQVVSTTRVVTQPARTEVKTVRALSTVTVTSPPPPTTGPPASSGTASP